MSTLAIGAKIWAKTVVFNAVFFGVGAAFINNWEALGGAFILLIGGFIITLPLLMIIVPLVQLSAKIPYSIKGRIAWLAYYLMLIIIAFYMVLNKLLKGDIDHPFFWTLTGTTIAGLLVAVYTTRTSLLKLYQLHDEAALLLNDSKI